MDIVAIIACRNEEACLGNCLRHLLRNGVFVAVIDNGSTDRTPEVLKRPDIRKGLVGHEIVPFAGIYSWELLLERKVKLADRLSAEWVIHHDADEVMHSYRNGETVHDAICRLAADGANVVNFDEFVFLPVDHDYVPDAPEYQPMRHYYFFEPKPRRLMRAWRTGLGQSMISSGGHKLSGCEIVLAPDSLAMRHYIFQSQDHAFRKYAERCYSEREAQELRWHGNRINQPVQRFAFPPVPMLETLEAPASVFLKRTNPRRRHYWQWDELHIRS